MRCRSSLRGGSTPRCSDVAETITINGRSFNVVLSRPAGVPAKAKRPAHRVIERPLDGPAVASGTLTLSLPPPSTNGLYANARKGRRKTLAYRNWGAVVQSELRAQPSWHIPGKVRICITSSSRADVDNRNKALLDSLVAAGRIVDDSPKFVIDSRTIHDPAAQGTVIKIEAVTADGAAANTGKVREP